MSNQLTRKLNSLVWPTQILNQEVKTSFINLKPVDKMLYFKKKDEIFDASNYLEMFNDIKHDLKLFQLILVMNRNLKRIYTPNILMAH